MNIFAVLSRIGRNVLFWRYVVTMLVMTASLTLNMVQAQTYLNAPLYSFTGGADGALPLNLIRDGQGNLYGTTYYGGAYGDGVVYKMSRAK